MSTNPLKECKRCQTVMRHSEFNTAFDCCKKCVGTEDYDRLQPEISKLMRGFSAQDKSEIIREAFMESKKRIKEALYGQKDKEGSQGDGQKNGSPCCAR